MKHLPSDGKRILTMRLWPRGVRKDSINLWLKDVGASRELIKEWKARKITSLPTRVVVVFLRIGVG
ncbi:DUF488 family protein, partial [Candidatus Bathyarchaeota archaeon]